MTYMVTYHRSAPVVREWAKRLGISLDETQTWTRPTFAFIHSADEVRYAEALVKLIEDADDDSRSVVGYD